MKTRIIAICAVLGLLLLSSCAVATSKKLAKDLDAFGQLGVSEVVITGKFSHTDYTVTHENGVRKAVINHTNVWVPQIKVVRETPDKSTP